MPKQKSKPIVINPGLENEAHLLKIEYWVKQVAAEYDKLILQLAEIAAGITNLKPNKVFNFADYTNASQRATKVIESTNLSVTRLLRFGIEDGEERANLKNDKLVDRVMQNSKLKKSQLSKYYNRNLEALAQNRTPAKELSKRVWNITNQFKFTIENGLDVGLGEGKGARKLASELMKDMNEPEFIFKRVRDKRGKLAWSRNAKKFMKENPGSTGGPGVAFNPRRNYERLTRTEINRSYRKADQSRYEALDFVVGVEIKLSNNPNHCKVCQSLAGKYPKYFQWSGWHP